MITTTALYKTDISGSSREIQSKIDFHVVDVTAIDDATITSPTEAEFSQADQICDDITEMSGKLATCETDYWLLDGTFVLPPKASETGFEVGWWSVEISDVARNFAHAQTIQIDFTQDHSSIGLTIYFDTLADEYAEDFYIYFYDAAHVEIYSTFVSGNTLSKYELNHSVANYQRVKIIINQWGRAYRRARVSEVVFGIVEDYTDTEIISIDILEELDTLNTYTTANEIKFTIDNQSQLFNFINPTGIYAYLQRRQKIIPYLGLLKSDDTVEWIPMGVYYLTDWQSDQGALTASFTGRDILDLLSQGKYRKGYITGAHTATWWAENVLTDAGITEYDIDSALDAITLNGCIPIVSHRDALQIIAQASRAVVYCDRYGRVILKQLPTSASGETISMDDMYTSPQIKLDKLINIVNVNINSFTVDESSVEIYKATVAVVGSITFWAEFQDGPCVVTGSATTVGAISTVDYGNASLVTITGTGTATVTLTGNRYKKSSQVYQLTDPAAPTNEQSLPVQVDNPMIGDSTTAAAVATWILAEYDKRSLYAVNWRMDPAMEAGDIVTCEDDFSENKTMRITKNDFRYSGYLGGTTSGKGDGT